jgi:hypothetical protein
METDPGRENWSEVSVDAGNKVQEYWLRHAVPFI